MSTDYYLTCTKCNRTQILVTRGFGRNSFACTPTEVVGFLQEHAQCSDEGAVIATDEHHGSVVSAVLAKIARASDSAEGS